MILRKAAFLLICGLFAFSMARFAFPASVSSTITIDPTQSIQEAINSANEGDTIFMKNGTYAQSYIMVNKTVTLLGESPEGTIIDGERASDAFVILNVITSNVRIMNLTIQNTTSGSGYIGVHLAARTRTIVQSVEVSGCIIRSSGTGIRLYNSSSCRIERNKIVQNSGIGIELQTNGTNNLICDNLVANNQVGIHAADVGIRLQMNGTNNLICDNLVANNQVGIHAEDRCGSNAIYHNNFVDNSLQTLGLGISSSKWDNGYPSGGNYWSDYSGGDSFNGLNQNLTGSDGIGDMTYPNLALPLDYYPFVGQIRMLWAGKWGSDYYIWIASNSTDITDFRFSNSTIPHLQFNVTGLGFLTYSCRVAVPKQLMRVDSELEWQVTIDSESKAALIQDDADFTYFYMDYTYETVQTKSIQINGTHTIPEMTWPLSITVLAVLTVQTLLMKKRLRRRVCAKVS